MWITQKEIINDWGGKREEHEFEHLYRDDREVRLPFNYCNLTLQPAKDPYCSIEAFDPNFNPRLKDKKLFGNLGQVGIVYDLLSVVPFLQKHSKNPMTGKKMAQSDLVKLVLHYNEQGEIHCPVTFKKLTEAT